jgi:hypothetical protein
MGKSRPTVLKAVVCGPCWAAHGGHAAATEIGPEPGVTAPSLDPTDQAHWMRALRRQDWVQAVRTDGQTNLIAVARLVALYAQWDTLESRPTWARLISRSGLSERTVARWLQELRVRGWLAHLEHGSTPETRPMALAHLQGNRAALYGLRIPLTPQEALTHAGKQLVVGLERMLDEASEEVSDQAQPDRSGDKSGSLPELLKDSSLRTASGFSRASEPVDNSSTNRTSSKDTPKLTALRAGSEVSPAPDLSIMVPVSGYQMLACADWLRARLPVFARCSRKLVRHLCKPYWRAGWCGRDIVHAMDHRPSVFSQPHGVLIAPAYVVSPTQFIRSRLQAWRKADGAVGVGYWQAKVSDASAAKAARAQVVRRHGRAAAALLRAGERSLVAERITEHGRAMRSRSSGRALPSPTPPVKASDPRDRSDRLRAEMLAQARAELARRPAPEPTDIPTTPPASGATPYERARARAHAEHGKRPRRRRGF